MLSGIELLILRLITTAIILGMIGFYIIIIMLFWLAIDLVRKRRGLK